MIYKPGYMDVVRRQHSNLLCCSQLRPGIIKSWTHHEDPFRRYEDTMGWVLPADFQWKPDTAKRPLHCFSTSYRSPFWTWRAGEWVISIENIIRDHPMPVLTRHLREGQRILYLPCVQSTNYPPVVGRYCFQYDIEREMFLGHQWEHPPVQEKYFETSCLKEARGKTPLMSAVG